MTYNTLPTTMNFLAVSHGVQTIAETCQGYCTIIKTERYFSFLILNIVIYYMIFFFLVTVLIHRRSQIICSNSFMRFPVSLLGFRCDCFLFSKMCTAEFGLRRLGKMKEEYCDYKHMFGVM
ncbi:Hypothetical predicted protein [Olea europaea subsp. europaea]|uniref:Uncharacterized protein n=1 Tax=Olea europaea subsp. europaea TaxID=158383 RepID=A0A8S0V3H1_OLEEU|nr:Hypothetical predicted protein [Olea europaea subsp. europaea]